MIIESATKQYEVMLYKDFSPLKNWVIDERTFIVIDKNVYEIYQELFGNLCKERIYILEAVEGKKVLETALEICEAMTELPAKRNSQLISIGGGIVQDITGFAANILYRGVQWTFFPSTLLAACDSCIGGKTSLNYKRFKNLLGTFYPPNQIEICTPFFETLSECDFRSGLGEVVKFHIMQGEKGISCIEKNIDKLLKRDTSVLMNVVESCLAFKKTFIEQDEFDKGLRIHLNYAHTFGHAFETVSGYEIPHGTAVAMGAVVANRISLARGWLDLQTVLRIENILYKVICINPRCAFTNIEEIVNAIHKDKKQVDGNLTAVLMKGNNLELELVHDLIPEEIETAVNDLYAHMS